jgi:RNAse (barnase) inhibitor barstar
LDLSQVETRESLHTLLYHNLALPEYYGSNWDAFWEVINEHDVLPRHLVLSGWTIFRRRLPREADLMRECLSEFQKERPNYSFSVDFVGDTDPEYPCPCCGYIVFLEPPGSYEICPICFWEDDALQLEYATTLAGGANGPTLAEAQENYRKLGVSEERLKPHVRTPASTDRRDPLWRPIDLNRDRFPNWHQKDSQRAPEHDERLYYWRPSFWLTGASEPAT